MFFKKASDSKFPPLTLGLNQKGELYHCPSKPNCVSSTDQKSKNQVMSIYVGHSTWEELVPKLEEVFSSWKGAHIEKIQENYMHITFRSSLFKFIDDLELHLNGHLHVRSASRVGYSDLGANRKRVEKLRGLIAHDLKVLE